MENDRATDENKELVRRMLRVAFNEGRVDVFEETVDEDVVFHTTTEPDDLLGREAFRAWLLKLRAGFPDIAVDLDELVAEGDLVAVLARVRGTHLGDYRGVPPTSRRTDLYELLLFRLRDGRCVEAWQVFDQFVALQQLGIFPRGDPPRALARAVVGAQRLGRLIRGRR